MTKVKLKEATKEINQKAGAILEESARIRRNAESLLQSLQKQRTQMQREKEEAQKRQQVQQHTKAWTMPDDETVQEAPAVAPVAQPKAPAAEAAPAPKPAAAKPAAPAPEKAAPAAVKKEEKPAVKEQPKQEPKAEAPSAPAEKPAAAPVEAVKPAEKPAPAAAAQPPVRPAVAPAPRVLPARPGQQPPRPAQPGARPGQPTGVFAQRAQGGYPPRQGQPSRPGQPTGVFAQRQQGGYPPRPGQGGPRPQGQGGFAPRPQGQGNFAPRPGQGGPRPQGQGAPRPGQGGPRPGGMGQRPQQGSRAARGPELAPVVEKERVSNYDPNKKQYIRQHDPERVAKSRKQLAKESANMNGGMDDEVVRGGKRARAGKKQPSAQQMMAPIHIDKAYMTAEHITVKDLTERIGKPAGEILKKLFLLGIMANINSELDFDTASLVCTEFGVELEMKLDRTAEDALTEETGAEDTEDQLQPRPPVITIMGHVDHGKTSLLDYIRKSHVTAGEAGGITQHIGAYTVNLNGRIITFLDTPGHEAFTAMRARGTQATDIAVLVVAADDGVMPQTVESINHARAAGVPIIVAINKMDKEGANPDRVKQDLTAYNLVPEEWGGDTIMAPVSALTGEGVDDLLEMILLQADVMQLRANPNRMARGVIIEAKLDKNRGPLATVLLKNGTLHVGDNIVAGMASGRVRAMLNDRGERVKEAGPSMPVEIAGFTEVPEAGDDMMAVADDRLSRQVAQERREKMRAARTATTKVSLDNLFDNINEGKLKNLNLIVKADVQGSVEAVKQALEKLSNDEVKVHILHSAVGAITKDDVNLASAFGAIIIGFNIRPDASAREAAAREEVDIRLYRIIYQAIEDIEAAMKGMLAPQYREEIIGHAEVRSVFKVSGVGMVAGCYVKDGKLQRNASVRLVRDNIVVFDGKLSSLRRFKDDVKEVAAGYECGVGLENYNDIKENDEIECFIQQEIER
ncbi:MAG: translation initiation factor IF-2 [Clostridiales bacterium]|nr:translation initiation factor IF-2 [Clostridiales bacterium]MDY5469324.1 translation initiation factor IF-2 [Eubacteriales bacterium]